MHKKELLVKGRFARLKLATYQTYQVDNSLHKFQLGGRKIMI